MMAALIAARVGRLTDVLAGFGNPLLIDGERLLERLWPEAMPARFEGRSGGGFHGARHRTAVAGRREDGIILCRVDSWDGPAAPLAA
jgi:hypothetical protein